MKVSVIIPTHNPNSDNLKEAVYSALDQDVKPYEIIIIDDASDKEVKFNNKIVEVLRIDNNSGPSAARNFGIKNSQGDLISFLDDDDRWLPHKLRLSINEFSKDQSIGMVCGNYCWFIDDEKTYNKFYNTIPRINIETMKRVNFVASGSVTVKKKVLDNVGLFNESLWVGEDYELWLRILKEYPIKFINEVLYLYRRNDPGTSLSSRVDLKNKTFNIRDFK